jgi:molecular chaperone HscB
MLLRQISRRLYSTGTKQNFFKLFPKATAQENPFQVDLRQLRKEYRALQQIHHPDRSAEVNVDRAEGELPEGGIDSQLLNKAYNTLRSPLSRAQYILELNGVDTSSESLKSNDNFFLMEVLEVHDALENAVDKEEVAAIGDENERNINEVIQELSQLFAAGKYSEAKNLVLRLRYYTNIEHAVANWEAGKPISLSH